jgi:hypothetical protein
VTALQKVMIFAVRVDTFAKEEQTKAFYIARMIPLNSPKICRHALAHFKHLPSICTAARTISVKPMARALLGSARLLLLI